MTHIQQKEVTRKKLFRVTKFFKESFKCFRVNYVSVQSPELPESLHISRQKAVTNSSLICRKPTGKTLQYFLYRKVTALRLTRVLGSVYTVLADLICF
jgi:hypothetical protein